jgi:tripartite-type tricarboxylate transporter receptor subunit TctC
MKTASAVLLALSIVGHAAVQAADAYPSRPIRFLVPQPPGGPTDVMGRVVGQRLTEALGQPVVLENRPGAGGNIGTVLAARATPDGYTILLQSSAYAVNPSLYSKAGYDPIKDFVPVINGGSIPNLIFAHPSFAANTLQELIALGKKQKLMYASSGTGTTPHLTAELLLKTVAGLDITHISFGGAAPAVNGVVAGQVLLGSTALTAPAPLIKAGRLKGIVVTSPQRTPALPEVPTAAESGFPGYVDYTWIAFFAPAGTPRAIVDKLNSEIAKTLQVPAVRERLAALGFDPQPNTPDEFAAFLKTEIVKWAKVVKTSGAKAD